MVELQAHYLYCVNFVQGNGFAIDVGAFLVHALQGQR